MKAYFSLRDSGVRVAVEAPEVVIGREQCGIKDAKLSRRQLTVKVDPASLDINVCSMGMNASHLYTASNGTLIEMVPHHDYELNDGDVVWLLRDQYPLALHIEGRVQGPRRAFEAMEGAGWQDADGGAALEPEAKRARCDDVVVGASPSVVAPAARAAPVSPPVLPVCKYGDNCYRNNARHRLEFRHPLPAAAAAPAPAEEKEPVWRVSDVAVSVVAPDAVPVAAVVAAAAVPVATARAAAGPVAAGPCTGTASAPQGALAVDAAKRESCPYGRSCGRKGAAHFAEFEHGVPTSPPPIAAMLRVPLAPSCAAQHSGVVDGDRDVVAVRDEPVVLAFATLSTGPEHMMRAEDSVLELRAEASAFLAAHANAVLVVVEPNGSLEHAAASVGLAGVERLIVVSGDLTRPSDLSLSHTCVAVGNRCNWRLLGRGTGDTLNNAVFAAGGEGFASACKQAGVVRCGTARAIEVPLGSPLRDSNGVRWVVHALGPSMNPLREGSMVGDPVGAAALLRAAYRAMFEEFWRVCGRAVPLCVGQARSPQTASGGESALVGAGYDRLSLSHYVDNTAAHREKVFHVDSECVVVWDMYPKARRHLLLIPRACYVDAKRPADLRGEHLRCLRTLHRTAVTIAQRVAAGRPGMTMRVGYHSVPSMQPLHLHIISQDFDSIKLKEKNHYNSFTTEFFLDAAAVERELESRGFVHVDEAAAAACLRRDMVCHVCRAPMPNIPKLKAHLADCAAVVYGGGGGGGGGDGADVAPQ